MVKNPGKQVTSTSMLMLFQKYNNLHFKLPVNVTPNDKS